MQSSNIYVSSNNTAKREEPVKNRNKTEKRAENNSVTVSWNLMASKTGKTKGKGGVGYEASTSFTACDIREKYQSEVHRPLEH